MSNRKDVPEECRLGAHHTGDGWALFVANADDDIVCYLAWPEKWPALVDTSFLIKAGFKID